jgi:hypothetical protein
MDEWRLEHGEVAKTLQTLWTSTHPTELQKKPRCSAISLNIGAIHLLVPLTGKAEWWT